MHTCIFDYAVFMKLKLNMEPYLYEGNYLYTFLKRCETNFLSIIKYYEGFSRGDPLRIKC